MIKYEPLETFLSSKDEAKQFIEKLSNDYYVEFFKDEGDAKINWIIGNAELETSPDAKLIEDDVNVLFDFLVHGINEDPWRVIQETYKK